MVFPLKLYSAPIPTPEKANGPPNTSNIPKTDEVLHSF